MPRKLIFLLIITFQCIVIVFLGQRIIQNNVLGKTQINPIPKDAILFDANSPLKNFYEYKPGILKDIPHYGNPLVGTYSINRDTLNDRYEYEVQKPKDTYRIITLGDSFTFGLFVDTPLNWPEKLEDKLNNDFSCQNYKKFEVINLGVAGYDIQYALTRYEKRGAKYNPDLVIWLLFEEDYRQIDELIITKAKQYEKELQESGELKKLIDAGDPRPAWTLAWKDSEALLGKEKTIKLQEQFLERFNSIYKNSLVVMSFEYEKKEVKDFYRKNLIKRDNTYYFDSLKNIYNTPSYFYQIDGHPTSEGHTVIAKEFFNYLNENQIIPCN
ncbi:MAG TPA: SGNH/GDSL hydrolase family protein [Candidatus Woesebacteria bacterium]|nr:SGNH/GDSL hydrolase family protein [Candidatus Woesebacteria bacterium]